MPTQTAPARRTKSARPLTAEPTNLDIWRAAATSPFNQDAAEIVRMGQQLRDLVGAFLDRWEGDEGAIEDALRAAGITPRSQHHRETAANILADMSGLDYVLELALGVLSSVVIPEPKDTGR